MLSLLYLKVKAQQYLHVLTRENLAQNWLNPGLNLVIFRGTRPYFLTQTIRVHKGRWSGAGGGGLGVLKSFPKCLDVSILKLEVPFSQPLIVS